ncbi:MAG: helix-turn-helix transcriptional regulator [Eubacteriales bacterium]|nr:helix-turn-helix transcriptional regulator [Eubacteriales bacterium]
MTKIDAKQTGALIRERRQAIGWTQKQLADALFVTDKAISKWENGDGLPDISLLLQLAAALQITTDELLAGARRVPDQPAVATLAAAPPLTMWLAAGIAGYLWLNHLVGQISSLLVNRLWLDSAAPGWNFVALFVPNQLFWFGLLVFLFCQVWTRKIPDLSLRAGSALFLAVGALLSLSRPWFDLTGLLALYGSHGLIALTVFLAVWQSRTWPVRLTSGLAGIALIGELAAHLMAVCSASSSIGLRVAALPLAIGRLLLLTVWILVIGRAFFRVRDHDSMSDQPA